MTSMPASASAGEAGSKTIPSGARVEIQRLKFSLPKGGKLIDDISLVIRPGELVPVFAAQAASGSAFVRLLAGHLDASGGQVLIDGEDLKEDRRQLRGRIAYVPAAPALHPELTVLEVLQFAARLRLPRRTPARLRQEHVQQVLAALGLEGQQKQRLAQLNALDRRKVDLGMELVGNPHLVLVDTSACELDVPTENAFFALLRRLAGQGLTIVAAARASGPLLAGDKALILSPAGGIAWYGPPKEGLAFFSDQPSAPIAGYDTLLNLLTSPGGQSLDWVGRYHSSNAYQMYTGQVVEKDKKPMLALDERPLAYLASVPAAGQAYAPPSGFSQFFPLFGRALRLVLRQRLALFTLLALPWLVAALDLVISDRNMYDQAAGNADRVHLALSLLVFFAMAVAGAAWVGQVSREARVYFHERQVGLSLLPYVLSRVVLVAILAVYQALAWTAVHFLAVSVPGGVESLIYFFVTMVLVALVGGVLGLLAAALARSERGAAAALACLLVPQLVFGGALLPEGQLNRVGQAVSAAMPARYAFDALVNADGHALDLANDPCWQLPAEQRRALSDSQKLSCTCLGAKLFATCHFPGLMQFYSPAIDQPEPSRPSTSIPLLPVQPMPKPGQTLDQYLNDVNAYTLQLEGNSQDTNQYLSDLRAYMNAYSSWQAQRSLAVGRAEGLLEVEFARNRPAFQASLLGSWLALLASLGILVILLTLLQKRKDRIAYDW